MSEHKTDQGIVVDGLLARLEEIDNLPTLGAIEKSEIRWLRDSVKALLLIEAKRQQELAEMHKFFESLAPDLGAPIMGA
jgi:hypothetical protein